MQSSFRTIHYCWFGGSPLGEKERTCIESWKRYLPAYEIIRWDETNFDVQCCDYVREAYRAKKWAFVSDYARFKILYDHGGLYFDTDVEILKPLDDLIAAGPFMGFETDCPGSGNNVASGLDMSVAPGLGLYVNAGLSLYELILDSYGGNHFIKPDGTMDKTTVVARVTEILRECGLRNISGIQEIAGIKIYPSEYFNPKDFYTGKITLTTNTRSIHHFDASWYTPAEKLEHRIGVFLRGKGASDVVSKKVAALIRIIRYGDISRIKTAMRNRL